MVTIAELLDWRPGAIDSLAEHFYDKRKILLRLEDEIHDARPPESWVGLGTVSAWKTHDAKRIRLNDLAAQISDLAVTLKETGTEVKGAQDELRAALDRAGGEGYSVNHRTGEITPPKIVLPPDPRITDPSVQAMDMKRRVAAVEREQAARMEEFAERIEKALDRADWADAGLAKAMAAVTADKTLGGSGSIKEAAAQLPPSLDGLTPEEIAEKLGNQIAIETINAYLEGHIPVYKFFTADFAGSAEYKVMQDGTVRMSLHFETGVGLRAMGETALKGGVGAGGFTDFEIAFESKEAAQRFLAGLDDAAKEVSLVAGRPMLTGLGAYLAEQNVISKRVGLYGEGDFKFKTPYAEGGAGGRAEGWYDEEKKEFGVKVKASFGGAAGHPETGVKVGTSVDLAGEVTTDAEGKPKEVTLSGAVTGQVANNKLGLNIPGVGSGGGGDIELKMNRENVMWGEMQEALQGGDMSRAAEIAKDHGQVVFRATTVTATDQEIGAVEAGGSSTSSQQAWVRPANTQDFVAVDPDVRPTQ
jgi:hypothetical protein